MHEYSILQTSVDPRSEQYRRNYEANLASVAKLDR